MDRDYRRAQMDRLHPKVKHYTHLAELDREYTLEEIAIITRAGPARALGLKHKGHLGAGADADITIYRPQQDKEAMFARPVYVFKGGKIVVRDGQVVDSYYGKRFLVSPPGPNRLSEGLEEDFAAFYSISLSNYAVEDEYVLRPEVIPCT
jgi:formylmethanofuran dehydrogenase subunit A